MTIISYVLIALFLDLLIGDPRRLPHPVRWMGMSIKTSELICRRFIKTPFPAGVITVAVNIILWVGLCRLLLVLTVEHAGVLNHVLSILMIYYSIAVRDLSRHSRKVSRALQRGDLDLSRKEVAKMVGRDTGQLDETGVIRACIESIAESIVDSISAPVFYAVCLGPVGAIAYRCVNTMDSMLGYKNEMYIEFGKCAARLDDVVNYIPARLTAPFICLASLITGQSFLGAIKILRRDSGNHSSPNSGLSEAAMAGALNIQLGGASTYSGKTVDKATIGDPEMTIVPIHIVKANRIMIITVLLFTSVLAAVSYGLLQI
ncbi:cobalamin biosynthesis protein CobD [bacterium AH-315-E10]|nr:cobalamin biosynthesis protein CobD [bacterium AH-315-E10]